MDSQIQPKMPLKATQERELRLYFFIVKPTEKLIMVLSYDLDDASLRASSLTPKEHAVKYIGFRPMQELLGMIQMEGVAVVSVGEVETPQIPKIGKDQFKFSLMLVKDEYVKDEEDKKILDKIINEL